MPPLTWRNVDAPDLEKASRILNSAVGNLSGGLSSAGDTFRGIADRKRRDASAALVPMLAGIQNSGQVDSVLSQIAGSVDPTMLTPEIQAQLLAQRGQTANVDGIMARTMATQGAEGRSSELHSRDIAREDQAVGMAGDIAAMNYSAYTGGSHTDMSERDLLALTLQAEAGGEGYNGMVAAGSVIANRARSGAYGGTIRGNIMAPAQFSAWNGVTGYAGGEGGLDMANMRPGEEALRAADDIISGRVSDPTGGATHYYNPNVASPAWGGGMSDVTTIGNHRFGKAGGLPQGAPSSIPDVSRLVPEGNLQLPSFYTDLQDSFYADQRTGVTDRRTDRNNARTDLLADQEFSDGQEVRDDTRQAEADAEEARNFAYEMRNKFGPGAEGMNEALADVQNTPGISVGDSEAQSAAIRKYYTDNAEYLNLPDQAPNQLDASVQTAVTELTAELDQEEFLMPDSVRTVVEAGARESGTESSDAYARVVEVMGEEKAAAASSPEALEDYVNDTFDHFDGKVPKAVIYGYLQDALEGKGDWNPFRGAGFYIDREKLIETISPLAEPGAFAKAQLQVSSMANQRALVADQVGQYQEAGQEVAYWSGRPGEEAAARVDAALARQAELSRSLGELAVNTRVGTESDGTDKSGNGTGRGTEDAPAPGASAFQGDTTLRENSYQLPTAGTEEAAAEANVIIKDLVTQYDMSQTQTGQANPELAAEAEKWLVGPEAASFFGANPEQMYEMVASGDPVLFYAQLVESGALKQ